MNGNFPENRNILLITRNADKFVTVVGAILLVVVGGIFYGLDLSQFDPDWTKYARCANAYIAGLDCQNWAAGKFSSLTLYSIYLIPFSGPGQKIFLLFGNVLLWTIFSKMLVHHLPRGLDVIKIQLIGWPLFLFVTRDPLILVLTTYFILLLHKTLSDATGRGRGIRLLFCCTLFLLIFVQRVYYLPIVAGLAIVMLMPRFWAKSKLIVITLIGLFAIFGVLSVEYFPGFLNGYNLEHVLRHRFIEIGVVKPELFSLESAITSFAVAQIVNSPTSTMVSFATIFLLPFLLLISSSSREHLVWISDLAAVTLVMSSMLIFIVFITPNGVNLFRISAPLLVAVNALRCVWRI